MAYNVFTIVKLLALVLIIKLVYNQIRVFLFKRKHGCKPEARIPQFDRIFGFDIYRVQLQASKEKKSLELAKERYDKYGNTWSVYMMGKTFYNTIETENIKTVLATDFKSFGLGERQSAFDPLLGRGIFTTGIISSSNSQKNTYS
jgi:hypothetical protein